MRSAIIESGVVVNVIVGKIPGSIECGPDVSKGWTYSGGAFAAPVVPEPDPEPITPDQIKAEAYQRIIAIYPEWKQRNLTAQASILAEKGRVNWSAEELAAWDAGEAIWQQIAAVRARSDELEAMDPIPLDYADDKHWP